MDNMPFCTEIASNKYFDRFSMMGALIEVFDWNHTNFGFLRRKLKFVHVGIVQIFIFFKKSARRF